MQLMSQVVASWVEWEEGGGGGDRDLTASSCSAATIVATGTRSSTPGWAAYDSQSTDVPP